MPDGKGDGSMYKKIEVIDERLDEHGNLIKGDILPRLNKLEYSQAENEDEIKGVKSELQSIKTEVTAIRGAQSNLELTVLKDGAQTRELLNRFVDHYFQSDGKAFKSNEKVTTMKLNTKEKVWLAVITVLASGLVTAGANVSIAYFSK